MKLIYEIKADDIGKGMIRFKDCPCCGTKKNPLIISDLIGKIMASDIGKRIYEKNGVEYIENDEQLKKRLEKNKQNTNTKESR